MFDPENVKAPLGSVVGVVGFSCEPPPPCRESFFRGFQTVQSALMSLALESGTRIQESEQRVQEALECVGLIRSERKRLRNLNAEERRLYCLTKEILPAFTQYVLFQQKTDSPHYRQALQRIATEWNPTQRTLLFITEEVPFIEETCSHLMVFQGKRLLTQGKISEMLPPSFRVQVEVSGLNDLGLQAVRAIATKLRFETVPITRFTAYVQTADDYERIRTALIESGVTLISFVPETPFLADLLQRVQSPPH